MSSGVERCRAVSRCRVWHLDTGEHGFSLDGVEGCRGVSSWSSLSSWHGVSRCRVGVEVWCRGVEARAQEEIDGEISRESSLSRARSQRQLRLAVTLLFFGGGEGGVGSPQHPQPASQPSDTSLPCQSASSATTASQPACQPASQPASQPACQPSQPSHKTLWKFCFFWFVCFCRLSNVFATFARN